MVKYLSSFHGQITIKNQPRIEQYLQLRTITLQLPFATNIEQK